MTCSFNDSNTVGSFGSDTIMQSQLK